MAVNREFNWTGQQRVDIPHLRSVESAVRYDIDIVGLSKVGISPQIVDGFDLVQSIADLTAGKEVSELKIKVAGAKVIHPYATEAGSFFSIPSDQADETLNPQTSTCMVGGWAANQVNYLGVDFVREADDSTVDEIKIVDPNQNTESPYQLPLARTIKYRFHVSTLDFSYNRSFIALWKVTTNTANKITAIVDCRPLLGRLTPGGTVGSDVQPYSWPGGRPGDESTALGMTVGDKAIRCEKDLFRAIQTRLWELGGGQYWYSPTADRNVRLCMGASVFSSTGESFEVVSSNVHWKSLSFVFDNSPEYICSINDQTTDSSGLTDLADGDCLYCDIDRNTSGTISLQKGVLRTLGTSLRPGARFVVCWRIGSSYYVRDQAWPIGGSPTKIATTLIAGASKVTFNANGDDTTYPMAASLANSVAGGYSATCGGISHNIGVSGTKYLSAGPLFIGGDEGDEDILIQPWSGHKVFITADTDATEPVCIAQSSTGTPENTKIVKFGTLLSGALVDRTSGAVEDNTVAVAAIDGNGAFGMARTDSVFDPTFAYPSIPKSPDSESFGNINAKTFLRSSKVWMEDVAAVFDNNGSFFTGWTNTSPGVWQKDSTDALSSTQFFGVTPTLNMRVLVWFQADNAQDNIWDKYQWIYTITALGGGGNHAVLTRATDANTSAKVFKGCAVYNTGSGSLGASCFMITHPAPLVLETSKITISLTTTQTRDQYCVMWHDGSYTVIAEGPFYNHSV